MGWSSGLFLRTLNFIVICIIIVYCPFLPPDTHNNFEIINIAPPKELKGALEPNYHLEGAERLLEGRIYGPECLIARNNEIYTGIHGGEVIKLTANHLTHVTKIGQPCEDIFEEERCGRPLGLAFDTLANNLIVSDAYYGLWEVDLKTNKKQLLVGPEQNLPGKNTDRRAKTFNGVAVDQQGDIYWTDSSSDFTIQDLVFTLLSNPSGRLFKHNRAMNVSEVLLDDLAFPNGIVLSPDEEFIVVSETAALRLTKYYLKGPKAGQSEVFVEGLPGFPDNLTPDADGIWVPLISATDSEHPDAATMFYKFPNLRLLFVRTLALVEMPFYYINSYFPNKICQRFMHFFGNGEIVTYLSGKRATVVRVDWNGNIVGSLHGFDKSVGAISHVLEFNDYLYFGSPYNRYLARIKSPKAGKQPQIKIRNVRGAGMEPVVKPPVESTTAKPKATTTTTTTTTPKPTTTTTTTTTATSKPITTTTTTKKPVETTTTTTTTPKPTATTTTPKPTTTTPKPTATTPKPTATTPKPTTTTAKPTTTTAKPATTTTTPQPATTKKPAAGTTPPPKPTPRVPPKEPAPVKEHIPSDTKPPQPETLKVINKQGQRVEL